MPQTISKPYLLLDTCVAEYLLNPYIEIVLSKQISAWANNKRKLAISGISYTEMIDGAYKSKVKEVNELLDTYTQFEVTQRILQGAGILSNVYKAQNSKVVGSSLADKIIAATAFVYNLPLITADVKDFPYPFFTSIVSENIKYRKKNKDQYIAIAALMPNATMLNHWHKKMKWLLKIA